MDQAWKVAKFITPPDIENWGGPVLMGRTGQSSNPLHNQSQSAWDNVPQHILPNFRKAVEDGRKPHPFEIETGNGKKFHGPKEEVEAPFVLLKQVGDGNSSLKIII